MSLVTITEAAKLVGRSRQTLYRDIDRGRLKKATTNDGGTLVDTLELLRVYGKLHGGEQQESNSTPAHSPIDDFEELVETWEYPEHPLPKSNINESHTVVDKTRLKILEERIKALEHVVALESTLRKVKDEVTNELRARLAEKERIIKILESKVKITEDGKRDDHAHYIPKKSHGLLSKLFNRSR